jgi:epoxyqueuosine reductase
VPDGRATPTRSIPMPLTASEVKSLARSCGFDLCGIAPAEAFPELDGLREWLARGFHGEMHYIARSADKRCDPQLVVPGARSVIALGTLYNTRRPYSTEIADPAVAVISRYAWGDDYHDVIGQRMRQLLDALRAHHGAPFDARPYVDTGPVQERVFAQRAGLGWVGKNGCLINPGQGSWFFLSVVLSNLSLEPDAPGLDQCGTCSLCIEACPTGALVAPGVLDARRCLSYLTIELKGDVPEEFHAAVGSRIYGCDVCQDVCPFNQAAPVSDDPAWQPRPAFDLMKLADLSARPDDDWRVALRRSPMKRTGVRGLRRNLAIATRGRDAAS